MDGAWWPRRESGSHRRLLVFYSISVHVGFTVEEVALKQIFSYHFRFPCQFLVL